MIKDHSDSKRRNLLLPHGLLFQLAAMVILYAPSHRQDSTYHNLWYTNCGALAGTRNSSVGPPRGIDLTTDCTLSGCSTTELHLAPDITKLYCQVVVFVSNCFFCGCVNYEYLNFLLYYYYIVFLGEEL